MRKVVVSWSGGKDSMMALHRLGQEPGIEVAGLMSAFKGPEGVIGLHNTPRALIKAQADALGLPLYPVLLTENAPNSEYEEKHIACFHSLQKAGIQEVAFGDIHLETIKVYRDQLLEKGNMKGCYPLWQEHPEQLLKEFLSHGYRSIITAIDLLTTPAHLLGVTLDEAVASTLKNAGVDACGENGEYHSFVYDGPLFNHALTLSIANTAEEDFRPQIEMCLRTASLHLHTNS